MINDALLGRLLSEHRLAEYRRTGLIGCGAFLILPFLCSLWGFIASLTADDKASGAVEGFYISAALLAASLGALGLFGLVFFASPAWLKKYKLEIYEHGFVKKDLFKTQTCLWSEIREVRPILLVYHRRNTKPSDFQNVGVNTKYRGIYEVYKTGGGKITVSRKYTGIERLDDEFKKFCHEAPEW